MIIKNIKNNIAEILFITGFINIDIAFFIENIKFGLVAAGISLIVLGLLLALPKSKRK